MRDRSKLKPPSNFHTAMNAEIETPASFEEAINSENSDMWKAAMEDEIGSLWKNETWTLVTRPESAHIVSNKWVYRVKSDINRKQTFKARLVAKGFSQKEGIDYQETYSPVVRYESIRVLLAIAAEHALQMAQFDVKTAFLYGNLQETIYMEQITGGRNSHETFDSG